MNIDQLVAAVEADVNSTESTERQARTELDGIIGAAKRQGRRVLTPAEDQRSEALINSIAEAREARKGHAERLARAKDAQEDERLIDAQSRVRRGTGATAPKYDEVFRVGREQREYNPGSDPAGSQFLLDVCRGATGDVSANARLARHMQEERVERGPYLERAAGDATTSVFGGLVVPAYLVELTAPAAAARRPLADHCVKHPLPPSGMTLTIPTITTPTSAALQASQLSAVSSTSIGETDLTLTVQTAAGSQNVSRQAIDRGVGIDSVVLGDLFNRYNTALDSTLINQATTGLSAKAVGTLGSFTATAPTGALLYPKVLAAASGVEAVLLGAAADMAVMHSRRWHWLSKEMTLTWPLINSQGLPPYAGGVNTNPVYGSGFRGVLPNGIRVLVDNNVPTTVSANQDEIYIVSSSECHVFEDANAPAFIRAEQPNAASLGVLLVVYGYFAYTFDRYGAGSAQKIGGAGLTTPAF